MTERKLLRVVVIDEIVEHPNADALELAVNTFLIITGLICGVGGLLWIGVMVENKKIQLFKED